jgi:hypothetical protein
MRVYGSCLAGLMALTVSTSCALEPGPDEGDNDTGVTSQAVLAEERLLCQFDNRTFDLPAKQCFPAIPREARSVVFGLVASDIPEPSRRYTWDVRSIPSKSPQGTDLFTKSGCGPRDAGCTLSVFPREFQQQFLVVLEIVNVDVSPSAIESYSAVATIPAVLPLSACNFNGNSIPSGTSLTAFERPRTLACESCMYQTRTCIDGALTGYYGYDDCTPGQLRPGEECP